MAGYSEGGPVALIAASKEDRIAAVVLVAAIGARGADANLAQVTRALERSTRPDAEKEATLELQKQIQSAVLTGSGWDGIDDSSGGRPTHPGSRAFSRSIRRGSCATSSSRC